MAKAFLHITSSTIREDALCEEVPDECCGAPVGVDYGFVGGGLGVYHYCAGECERIYKRESDLDGEASI